MTRRRFLRLVGGTAVGSGAGIAAYAFGIEPHWVQTVRRELPITGLPRTLVGSRLVQISDLHVGPVVDDAYLTAALERVSGLKGDILCVTGDFITYQGDRQFDQLARVLESLEPGRLATLAVPGNHDYGPAWSDTRVADKLEKRLTDAGVQLLKNESWDVGGLQFIGIDDYWGPRFDLDRAMSVYDPGRAAIVLCHNPDAADEPVWNGYRGWVLCGHTHGGQCKPPFFNPPLLPVANPRYTAGEIDLFDGRRLYINRGLGYLKRVRFNVRPEITEFVLTRPA